jgi:hypothetical protein
VGNPQAGSIDAVFLPAVISSQHQRLSLSTPYLRARYRDSSCICRSALPWRQSNSGTLVVVCRVLLGEPSQHHPVGCGSGKAFPSSLARSSLRQPGALGAAFRYPQNEAMEPSSLSIGEPDSRRASSSFGQTRLLILGRHKLNVCQRNCQEGQCDGPTQIMLLSSPPIRGTLLPRYRGRKGTRSRITISTLAREGYMPIDYGQLGLSLTT